MNQARRASHSDFDVQSRTPAVAPRGRRAALASLAAAGKRVITDLRQARRRRKAIHELSALSDAALADIGVTRDSIPDVIDALMRTQAAGAKDGAPEAARTQRHTASLRGVADCPQCA